MFNKPKEPTLFIPKWTPTLAQEILIVAGESFFEFCDEIPKYPPRCLGIYVGGSGGHMKFAGGCNRAATWWSPLDAFSFCDEHVFEIDKNGYLADWKKVVEIFHARNRELK